MAGPAIEAVTAGVQGLVSELRKDPHALETTYFSIIAFADEASQLFPLTEVSQIQIPALRVRPGTALGAALRLLRECIAREVRKSSPDSKGDYRPLVFLLTDGQPTDSWSGPARDLLSSFPRVANIYAIGCGDDVDFDVLREVTDIVLSQKDMSPDKLRKMFVWLTASVQTASVGVSSGGGQPEPFDLSNLPADVLSKAPVAPPSADRTPRQVFLHARCSHDGRHYLMRFVRIEGDRKYRATAAHVLDPTEATGGSSAPAVPASLLVGCPPCPYCRNPLAGVCECGTVSCRSGREESMECPSCKTVGTFAPGGDFDIRSSQG